KILPCGDIGVCGHDSAPALRYPEHMRRNAEAPPAMTDRQADSPHDRATATTPGADIIAAARQAKGRGPAPVHLWNPPYCGEMDLEIRADGRWIHEGSPIGRPEMVRLFASVLKREGDRFFLVTPV